jgi:DNA-binding MarR family transcriptional regulator
MTPPRPVPAREALTDLACACASARRVARVLTQLYDGHLRPAGLEAPQFALLMALRQHGPCSQVTLGRRHGLDKTTVSRNLRGLERQGWIAAAAAGDRRERVFALSAAGRQRVAAALPKWKKAQAQLRSGMTAAQWATMFQTFRIAARAARAVR